MTDLREVTNVWWGEEEWEGQEGKGNREKWGGKVWRGTEELEWQEWRRGEEEEWDEMESNGDKRTALSEEEEQEERRWQVSSNNG